ncbi:MAG: hypothetical protein P8J66_02945 [Verrucomicrobiota bacterium]|nr:hypothetical protein [Verrucomicrobiota bacterium]
MINSNNGQVELSSQATFFLQSPHVSNVRNLALKGVVRAFLLCLAMWMFSSEAKPPNVILLMRMTWDGVTQGSMAIKW